MAIGEICSREVVFVARSESCAQAARLMRENHVGSLVVVAKVGTPGLPIGMITDRDLAVGVMALGLDPEKTLVEAVMRPRIALMRAEGVRRLPVVDADGDLREAVLREQALELAVGNDLDGLRPQPPALQQRGADERENEVQQVEAGALFHRYYPMTGRHLTLVNVGGAMP
jgi:CBS domain-containing protein